MFRGVGLIAFYRLSAQATYKHVCKSSNNQYLKCSGTQLRGFHASPCLADIKIISSPSFPESIAEGDMTWKKQIGDAVHMDEIIGEIETDKTALPVMSPVNGILTEFLVEEGGKVTPDQAIYKVDEKPIEEIKEQQRTGAPTAPMPVVETPRAPTSPTPVAIVAPPKFAAPSAPVAPRLSQPHAPSSSGIFGGLRSEQRVKMTRIRMRTAERLKEAQNTCAMLTTFNEVDMSNLIEMRAQYKDAFAKRHGVKLGIMSSFSKAAAFALKDQPIVNAYIDGNEIVYRNFVDLSIAVASPKGLVVPVLRNVETMNFSDLEKGIFELGEKAKAGGLAVEDMDGGTFTISNGGVFGSLFSTPIVNPPQSAILGLHGTFERPVARNGQVVIRPMMYVALSYDHRLIDGREAVLFLRKIKSFVEDPRIFFMGL